jgi:hypothetical protein
MVIRLLAGEEIDYSLRAARTMRHACLDETRFAARERAGQRGNVEVSPYPLPPYVILNFAYNNHLIWRLQTFFDAWESDGCLHAPADRRRVGALMFTSRTTWYPERSGQPVR